MNKTQLQFLEIIKCGLWEEYRPEVSLFDECDWDEVYRLAKVQTVIGIALDGVERAYRTTGQKPSMELLVKWVARHRNIENCVKRNRGIARKIEEALNEVGIAHAFMKGESVGRLYEHPFSRQTGDIDMVFSMPQFSEALRVFDELGKVDRNTQHETHASARVDGVEVEPHFRIHTWQSPKYDARMQRIFESLFPADLRKDAELGVTLLPLEFEGVFLLCHKVHHIFSEGLGLRQVLDYCMFLKSISEDGMFDAFLFDTWLARLGLRRANRVFYYICVKYLGLKMDNFSFWWPSFFERLYADRLMNNIMMVGNFGRAGYVFRYDSRMDLVRNFMWVFRRSISLGYIAPLEAMWWPVSKFKRFVRKHKGE